MSTIETHSGLGVTEVACSASFAMTFYQIMSLCAEIVGSGRVTAIGDTD